MSDIRGHTFDGCAENHQAGSVKNRGTLGGGLIDQTSRASSIDSSMIPTNSDHMRRNMAAFDGGGKRPPNHSHTDDHDGLFQRQRKGRVAHSGIVTAPSDKLNLRRDFCLIRSTLVSAGKRLDNLQRNHGPLLGSGLFRSKFCHALRGNDETIPVFQQIVGRATLIRNVLSNLDCWN